MHMQYNVAEKNAKGDFCRLFNEMYTFPVSSWVVILCLLHVCYHLLLTILKHKPTLESQSDFKRQTRERESKFADKNLLAQAKTNPSDSIKIEERKGERKRERERRATTAIELSTFLPVTNEGLCWPERMLSIAGDHCRLEFTLSHLGVILHTFAE